MCGIFGVVSKSTVSPADLRLLATCSQQRGKDSSGLFFTGQGGYRLYRATEAITSLLDTVNPRRSSFVMGHSRLITNGLADNQPVYRDSVCVIHNGIVVNHDSLWETVGKQRRQEIDTEIIAAIAARALENGEPVEEIAKSVISQCKGVVACAVALPRLGHLCLFSNNGSLYLGAKGDSTYFASESYPLTKLGCADVRQVRDGVVLDIPASPAEVTIQEVNGRETNLIPSLGKHSGEEKLLEYRPCVSRRCSKCLLPETMPFIRFDHEGVCNYCHHYKPRNRPRPTAELFKLVEPYRRTHGDDCIVPFSGGRDSCYGLHLIVNELKMKPITYTYDWGMVTDLGRRNISRMCAELGVENIIVADDITKKRKNIAMNLKAWLKSPHLGMVSILTAGDKHFFRHVETVKAQTGISLNLWGVNPLEVTHFKAGFLGVPPDFEEERVYSHGAMKQLRYHMLRLKAMLQSPGYFNRSLWDTLSGEYYRSFTKKSDYYHIFDYWRWDEKLIDRTLEKYEWEKAPDTRATWRIGDGTAAFYNYVYYSVAGFSEHDTFRSNQIREGDLTREEALAMVEDENRPRYPNIKWYLDAIGMDFEEVIQVVNAIPKLCR
ncbi:MAG: glucosamine 6-phosphate synthetase [Betaproteobacteria bacterium]|nr:MAG: glucosamine 6-phosphate synthetase [Betaproteobacteria bacterium]